MKTIAILQSNYIPWRGYFDLIKNVDEFILYDDMQYTRRDWRNRNKIKTANGPQWLSIPVSVKGKYLQKIRDTENTSSKWRKDHWKSIQWNYRKSKYYQEIEELLSPIYLNSQENMLTFINLEFIKKICEYLDIKTKITFSWDYTLASEKSERLASLVEQANGNTYVSGPAAKEYLNTENFNNKQISVQWFDYSSYKPYNQLWGEFDNHISIIDLLFNNGPNSTTYLNGFTHD